MFSLLHKALDRLGMELSAQFFMSDFEVGIRDAFLTTFPGIEAKGCSFHFSKAILSKVGKSGFKSDYQSSPEFGSFIRAIFGLAYVPLSRLAEGVRNLYILAKKLDDRQAKFALVMIHYVQKTWINGSFPPETWNMYQHEGQTTNNHSEGYNARLGNKKILSQHPNFYQWLETIKQELEISHDEAIAAAAGKPPNRFRRSKHKKNIEMREKLMLDLKEGTTALMSYQKAIGGSLSRAERICHDMDDDDEPLPISRSSTIFIVVPTLEEIQLPPSLSLLPSASLLPPSHPPHPAPSLPPPSLHQTPVSGQFRRVNVGQKRKSDLSYSVAGADLRRKRRRREAVSSIEDVDRERSKEGYLEFFGLPTGSKMTLDQGRYVIDIFLSGLCCGKGLFVTKGLYFELCL